MGLLFRAGFPFLCVFRHVSKTRVLREIISEKRKEETKENFLKKKKKEEGGTSC